MNKERRLVTKYKIGILLIFIVVLGAGILAFNIINKDKNIENVSKESGESANCDQDADDTEDIEYNSEMVAEGKENAKTMDICDPLDNKNIISRKYVNHQYENALKSNTDASITDNQLKEQIANGLIKDQAVFIAALENGVDIEDSEIDKIINEMKESIYSTKDTKESQVYVDYKSLIKGMGISEEEYWNRCKPIYKRNKIVEKYYEKLKAKINSLEKVELSDEEMNNKISCIEDELVKEYNVHIE